jgi:cellulose synthase/poly-beta-1,6-N-acetylglucosamine synthase-like glycosyltransferase
MAYPPVVSYSILIFNLISLIVLVLYLTTMIFARYGWKKLPFENIEKLPPTIFVSIIVAARNEANNLPRLLGDLTRQNYPPELMEIIVIDDHSDEKLSELPMVKENPATNFKLLNIPEDNFGKKQALIYGAKQSKGELLIFTDADCRVSPLWVRSFAHKYLQEKPGLMIGLVNYPIRKGMFDIFSRFDFLSLIITGAGFAGQNRPVMCNGANLAVRRDLYLKASPQLMNKIFSGDDIFLLHAVKKFRNEKITVVKSYDNIVISHPPDNFRNFMNQRMRWASKSKHYSDKDTIVLALLIMFSNLLLLVSLILFLATHRIQVFAEVFIIKTIADSLILKAGLQFFGGSKYLFLLPLFEIFYPLYILFVFFGSHIIKISWKGRNI